MLSLLTVAIAPGQEQSRRRIEIEGVLQSAISLPVELAADLVFEVVDTGEVPPDIALEYLERLYYRAGEAREKLPKVLAPTLEVNASQQGASDVESTLVYLQAISGLGLDSLSIRVRTLQRLLQLDARLGASLVASLDFKAPSTNVSCEEYFIPTVDPREAGSFYETLLVLNPTLLHDLLARISTPQEVASTLAIFEKLDDAAKATTAIGITKGLQCAHCSDRVFTTAEMRLKLGVRLEQLLEKDGMVPEGLKVSVVNAYVRYVERQLDAERCADVVMNDGQGMAERWIIPLAQRLAKKYVVKPIDLKRIETKFSADRVELPPGWDAAQSTEVVMLWMKFKESGSNELRDGLNAAIQRIGDAQFDTSAGDAANLILRVDFLAEIIPQMEPGGTRQAAVSAMISLLRRSYELQSVHPGAWLYCVRYLFSLQAHPDPSLSNDVRNRLLQLRDTAINAYWKAEDVLRFSEYDAEDKSKSVYPAL